MLHFHPKKKKRRLFSAFLALSLTLGSLSYSAIPVAASNVISDNSIHSNDYISESAASSDTEPDSLSESLPITQEAPENVPENTSLSGDAHSQDSSLDSSETDSGESPLPDDSGQYSEENITDERLGESDDTTQAESLDQSQTSDDITYTLIFDYNGGTDSEGKTSYTVEVKQYDMLSDYIQQVEDRNLTSPYTFKHRWDIYSSKTEELLYENRSVASGIKVKDNYTLKAIWSSKLIDYSITYNLNGGSFDAEETVTNSYTYDDTVTLPKQVKRKGYLFKGFYKDSDCKTEAVTSIPRHSTGDITLYAKWESAAPKNPVITKVSNPSSGKVKIAFQKMTGVEGYELMMSTTKSFKKNTNKFSLKGSATSMQLTNMPKGKTYYFKLRAYSTDSVGGKAYSKYSNVSKIKVSKGVKEYQAKSNSAKLKKCNVTGTNTLTVSFTVSKRIKSSDDSYYLVAIDPNTNKYSKKIEKTAKQKTVTFRLPIRDEKGTDLIQYKFALAVKSGSKYKLISEGAFISNPEAAAAYTAAFPKSHSKKGMQGSSDSDLGLSHVFINIDINNILLNGSIPYKYNGKTYYFNDAYGGLISSYNSSGLTVTGQIMLTFNSSTKYMILPSGRTGGKAYYAINVQEKKARETFEAATSFMAERYSTADCHLDNWIIGNEVNIYQMWYYAGNISKQEFMENYASTFRILYYSVRSHSKNSRVYICTDHTWTNRSGDWGAKPFMNAFNEEIKSQQKNIQWNLAYHAYPSILTSSATWNDILAPNSENADFVSPKNLSVMTNYVKKNFGTKTRVILSEQGFTSSSGTDVQAAAIAYTYYKAEFDDMIDAVLFRSEIDNSTEGAQGLYFGLKNTSGKKKPAYNVFKYMDTTKAEKYTNSYLKTIGISKWKDIAPKYDLKRFK